MATLPRFQYHQPSDFEQALKLMARYGSRAKVLAGGTDLLGQMKAGSIKVDHLVSLNRIESIRSIVWDDKTGLFIGAGVRINLVKNHDKVQAHYPALAYACSVMANNQIRNMGTVVGNVTNGSPCADTVCPLLCYDAVVKISGLDSERIVDIKDFFLGPSMVNLKEGEIVSAILIPKPIPDTSSIYFRHSARSKVDIACASSAVSLKLTSEGRVDRVRLTLGGVAPTAIRLFDAERFLEGKTLDASTLERAVSEGARAARPIDDIRASLEYRKAVIPVLLRRALADCRAKQTEDAK
jgi:carbon-monoxide dehydrogenase medium subunit